MNIYNSGIDIHNWLSTTSKPVGAAVVATQWEIVLHSEHSQQLEVDKTVRQRSR